MTREPGFYADVPEDEYHGDRESLSQSGAKLILKAPALYRWNLDHPDYRDSFDLGHAAHALVLGVGAPIAEVEADSWRTNAAKAARDEARAAGKVPLLSDDVRKVEAMAEELSGHVGAMLLLEGGQAEVSAYAPDEWTGVLRRCRYDYLRDDIGVDYKTSIDVAPQAFANAAARYGYDMQAAWYMDVAADLGQPIEDFAFIVQAKDPPYLVEVYNLDSGFVARGRARARVALDRYAACTKSGVWPGHTGKPFTTLSAPKWTQYETDLQENA